MKRSQVNRIICDAKEFLAKHQFALPPWAFWTPADWKGRYDTCAEIVDCMLGWDVTSFGGDEFERRGLTAFTLRNGLVPTVAHAGEYEGNYTKQYGEKILIVGEGQETPLHFHWSKMEDIINRGGGNLVIEFCGSRPGGELSDSAVEISIDGIRRSVEAHHPVVLTPGESVCVEPGVYHRFLGEPGSGTALIGEVSSVNDDRSDNRWYEAQGRFSRIEEDEPPVHLLVNDYAAYL